MTRIIVKYCVYLIICGAIFCMFYPLLQRANENPHAAPCQGNLKQIGLAIFEYAQDYNEKLPPAIFHDKYIGWANGLQPYAKSYSIFQCYADQNPPQETPQPDKPGFTDYWFNGNMAGVNEEKITSAFNLIMLGGGDGGSSDSTASYALNHFSTPWLQSSDSPIKRHLGGANYAFADGHVKWFKPEGIIHIHSSNSEGLPTFSVH